MSNLDYLLNTSETSDLHQDLITKLHLAVDQDGDYFDDMLTRIAFLRVAVGKIIGDEFMHDNDFVGVPRDDLNGKTPYRATVQDGQEGLKASIASLVKHYSM